jgi:hypothetical protein
VFFHSSGRALNGMTLNFSYWNKNEPSAGLLSLSKDVFIGRKLSQACLKATNARKTTELERAENSGICLVVLIKSLSQSS